MVASYAVMSNHMFAQDMPQKQKQQSVRKKRQQSNARKKQRAMQEAANQQRSEDAPIENMEQFANEYDHVGKQKAVDALLERGIQFCKGKDIRTICHAFTHTHDFIEGALYIFLIDTKGIVYAHGGQEDLIWKNLWDKHDMFGAPIIQSMIKFAHTDGGLFTYEWDGAIKVSRIKLVEIEKKEFIIGCGYFPHSKEYAVVSLVKGAVALFNKYVTEGRLVEGAFGDMSYPLSSQFVFGDLYLYALGFDGIIRAQGERPGLIGSPALDYSDSSGKKYNAEIIELLKHKEAGEGIWIDYVSKRASKRAYAEKVQDGKGNYYFIASGYYPEVTRDTTVDLVRRGYQLMKSAGLSKAIEAFDDEQTNEYRYGDLGLFVYDMKGKCLAHGVKPDYVGQDRFNSKDEDGRLYVKEIIEQAKAGGGWVSFKINNSFESAYVEEVDMGIGSFIVGAGMFPVSKPETMRLLVKSAIGYLNGHSIEDLLARSINRNDQFLRGDLFLYVLDTQGFCYGWGDSYQLIWKNLKTWKDENGKPFIASMIETAQHGADYLVFKQNKVQRVNYFEPIKKNGKTYIIGSGFYK